MRLVSNVQAIVSEPEANLIGALTKGRMAIARAKDKLKSQSSNLSASQQAQLVALHGRENTTS